MSDWIPADAYDEWVRTAQDAWDTVRRLREELARKDAILRDLVARIGPLSEVLSRAAERGRVCASCLRAFALEDLQNHTNGGGE